MTSVSPGTTERQRLDPRVTRVWRLAGGLASAPVAIALLVLAGVGVASGPGWLAPVGVLAAIALVLLAVLVLPSWRYRIWSWALTDEGLEIAHGVVVRVESAIPTFRVQQVDVKQGPIERLFGVVTLQISTASSASDGTLPGIDAGRADEVRRLILGRVAADDGV